MGRLLLLADDPSTPLIRAELARQGCSVDAVSSWGALREHLSDEASLPYQAIVLCGSSASNGVGTESIRELKETELGRSGSVVVVTLREPPGKKWRDLRHDADLVIRSPVSWIEVGIQVRQHLLLSGLTRRVNAAKNGNC